MAGINDPYSKVAMLLIAAEEDFTVTNMLFGAGVWVLKEQRVHELIKNSEPAPKENF